MLRFAWLSFLVIGCATGSELSATTGIGDEDEGGYGDSSGFGGDGAHGGEDDDTGPTSSGSSSGGAGGEGAGAGVGGAGVGGGGTGGSAPMCDFTSPNLCAGATAMNSIAGDDGGTSTSNGHTSQWFQIHVTEESGSISEDDMSYTVTLTSPPGMIYNLVVHQGPQDGNPNCGASPLPGTPPGGPVQTVHASWDDDQGIGGEDDSLWLSIEVVWVSGDDCSANWTLSVAGGT